MVRAATLLTAMIVAMAVLCAARPARALENCISVCDNAYCIVTDEHCIESAPAPACGAIPDGRHSATRGTSYHWNSGAEASGWHCATAGRTAMTARRRYGSAMRAARWRRVAQGPRSGG